MRYSTLAAVLLVGSVLLPQGIGLRLPEGLPNLDLPRLAALALLALLMVRMLTHLALPLGGAPRTLSLLGAVAAWQFVSALSSASSGTALYWAVGNAVNFWGLAIAAVALLGGEQGRKTAARALTIAAVLLALWSVGELVTQAKLFPYRNLWAEGEIIRFSTTLRRILPGVELSLPYASIGPFASNLSLGAALCALGGHILVPHRLPPRLRPVLLVIYLLAVFAAQSRVALAALLAMVFVSGLWARSRGGSILPMAAVIVISVVGLALMPGDARVSVASVMTSSLEESSAGSVQARLEGLHLLLQQIDRWGLVGFGPGSLFDAERVVTRLQVHSDPGSLLAFFVESGIPAGVLISWMVAAALLDGLRARRRDTRAATLGLIGFIITALVSLSPWLWGLAGVQAGLIEGWARAERAARAPSSAGRIETMHLEMT